MKRKLPPDFKVVCAWCNKHLRGPKDARRVSHGSCLKCYKKQMRAMDAAGYPKLRNPLSKLDIIKLAAGDGGYQKIKDERSGKKIILDGFTASMLLQVYNALNETNRAKFIALPWLKMVDVGWKLTRPKSNPAGKNWKKWRVVAVRGRKIVSRHIVTARSAKSAKVMVRAAEPYMPPSLKLVAKPIKNPPSPEEWLRYPTYPKKGRTGRPRNPTYTLKKDGNIVLRAVSYERLYRHLNRALSGGTRYGIDRPTLHALGYSIEPDRIQNPAQEKRAVAVALESEPFYRTLISKAAATLLESLRKGSFERRAWFKRIEPIVERAAREKGVRLTRLEKLRLTLWIAKTVWDKYVLRR